MHHAEGTRQRRDHGGWKEQKLGKARDCEENALPGDKPGWIKTCRLGDVEEELQREAEGLDSGRHTLSSLLYDLRSRGVCVCVCLCI